MKSKQNEPTRKQGYLLFFGNFISFTAIFMTLGLIIFGIFKTNTYHNIDLNLTHERDALKNGPKRALPIRPLPAKNNQPHSQTQGQPFKSIQIIFNAQGKITNAQNLGQRNYNYLRNIKLEKSSLNKKQTLQTNSGSFRTLLVKVSHSNPDPLYSGKYVLILQNIDSELQSINVFRKSLILTVVFLWLLAVIFSLILTVWAMRPINRSWQRQREFTADAAHELRAPLAVIQSQQEYLLTQPNKQVIDVADEIAKSLTEISRLQTLTNDLLLLARTDAAQLNLNLTLVINMNWLQEIAEGYQEIARSQKKSLVYQIDKQATLKIDVQRLKQVCVILLSNALQYTSAGDSIWINAKENERYLQIEIGNTGMPLAAADRPHIFERFYRGDTARNKYSGGNGLGLTIAQWIVNQHHGKIRVEDAHPKGVKFIVTLPLAHA